MPLTPRSAKLGPKTIFSSYAPIVSVTRKFRKIVGEFVPDYMAGGSIAGRARRGRERLEAASQQRRSRGWADSGRPVRVAGRAAVFGASTCVRLHI